jgi:hypothetical protein
VASVRERTIKIQRRAIQVRIVITQDTFFLAIFPILQLLPPSRIQIISALLFQHSQFKYLHCHVWRLSTVKNPSRRHVWMYEFSRHSGFFDPFPGTLETSTFKKSYRRESVIYFIGKTFLRNIFSMKSILLFCWLLLFRYVHKIAKSIC